MTLLRMLVCRNVRYWIGPCSGMSAFGTKRTDQHDCALSAFEGKADMSWVFSRTFQSFDRSRSATRRAISAGASSGIGNTELTLISPST